ncbi:LPXTG cell wall anchor domain-containing protein [Streptomyces spinoverrucosus]|uniref:LPXTG cell wall anchor domain-containing protein n=1 Tax=Streptomyces spinoverrucosus TaxID=284043 RepID=UPI0018C40C27|nr:LPXTG cell wall anchor domain-containing protein [Streptomyces spinoverrucosus]MBG0854850.1 LPXTG cell wall anchor domain-containing protein [Streptomyces spinoverrucosus]
MTNKTRIRVARLAAGAVIAAGASLTAAGVASADEGENCIVLDICISPSPTQTTPTVEPTPTQTEPTTPPTIPTVEPTQPTVDPTDPTIEPTEPDDPTANPTEDDPGSGNGNGSGSGGGDNTDPDGGTSPQDEGSSSLTDTGTEIPAADTSAQGGGDELAETGAAQTTFLLIGAATMIAGGVAFRVLPRVMSGRGGAAA